MLKDYLVMETYRTVVVLFQDGRIDYGEFVAMMQKGNMGVGRRTMRNSLNISMRDVAGAR